MSGGYELTIDVAPSSGGSVYLSGNDFPDKEVTLYYMSNQGYTFDKWTWSGFTAEPIPANSTLELKLPTSPVTVTANFNEEIDEGGVTTPPTATPTTSAPGALDDLLNGAENKSADELLNGIKAIENLDELMENPDELKKLEAIEAAYAQNANITTDYTIAKNTHGNFHKSSVSAVGLAFSAPPGGEAILSFSPPDKNVEVDGTRYKKNQMVQVDIKLLGADSSALALAAPIAVTVNIPSGIDPNSFVILHYFSSKDGFEVIRPRLNGDGTCTFIITSFSVFVFTEQLGSEKSSDDRPAPIVPVLYDIAKTGDSFTFKTIIANGSGNMAGATVTVRLNERYSTTVTIGADGVGQGTIETPGFNSGFANFSARVNGIAAPLATKAMYVYGSGRVAAR